MPVENEFKYVLHDPNENLLSTLDHSRLWRRSDIKQAYLSDGCRLRSIDDNEFIFTYKRMVGDELIEIELEIEQFDFDKLLTTVEPQKIMHKIRFEWDDGAHCRWAIDFFQHPFNLNRIYFVMAEFETDYDIRTPPKPVDVIADYLIHIDDKTYKLTSHALCDVDHAASVLSNIEREDR